MQVAYISS